MQVYFLKWSDRIIRDNGNTSDVSGAWPKLFADADHVYGEIGVKFIITYAGHKKEDIDLMKSKAETLLSDLKEGDILIVPFPMAMHDREYNDVILDVATKVNKVKIVAVTLDLFSYRHDMSELVNDNYKRNFNQLVTDEKHFLNRFDALIAQSEPMAKAIVDNAGYSGEIIVQGPWSFRTDFYPDIPKVRDNSVMFGGNLKKAEYMREIPQDFGVKFNVYGSASRLDADLSERLNLQFFDFQSPSVIDRMLHGGFGLIWDSTSYPNITGGRGFYMELAVPHKFSMYTVAGIPSIVWSKSCIAPLLAEKKIGWAVDSLEDLPGLISSITDEEYFERIKNLSDFSALIRDGFFQKRSIFKVIDALFNGYKEEINSDIKMKIGWV